MANFFDNLWQSVFTPGTTPTLLLATNVTFAALQLVLAALLAATYSIHFAILSFLCAGLWYSINWFAVELQAAQAKEQEAERLRRKKRGSESSGGAAANAAGREAEADQADDEGEDTEVEGGLRESTASFASISYDAVPTGEELSAETREHMTASMRASIAADASSSGLQPPLGIRDARRRKVEDGDRSGDLSTDSEWEKIDGDR